MENYKVFEVNDCFEEWGMSCDLIGAESVDALIEHLPKIMNKKTARKIIKDKEWRIREVEHLYTDTPYVKITGFGYIE